MMKKKKKKKKKNEKKKKESWWPGVHGGEGGFARGRPNREERCCDRRREPVVDSTLLRKFNC